MKSILKEDLSIITGINESTLNKINDKIIWCICDNLEKSIYNKENTADISLGYGTLKISMDNNEIKYKFIPSQTLEKNIIDTVINEKNPLVVEAEKVLAERITKIYKELF